MAHTGRDRGRNGRAPAATGPGRGRRRSARTAATPRESPSATSEDDAVRRRPKLSGRSAIVLVVLAVLFVSYATSMRAWLDQRADIRELEKQIAESEHAVAELKEEEERWKDPAFIEAQARQRFGWVLPGEIGFRVLDKDGKPVEEGSELTDPQSLEGEPDPQWWEKAWGSVQAAGTEPKAEAKEDATDPARRIGPNQGNEKRQGGNGDDRGH